MKTIMYSDIIRRNVELPNISDKAKIVDITAEDREKYWVSHGVIVETGFLDSKAKYYSNTLMGDITEKGPIIFKRKGTKSQRKGKWLLSKIKGSKVSKDDKEIGRVYDFEMFVDRKPWIIWKILVNPLGISPLKRRVKIGTGYVDDYKGGKLHLKSSWNRGD
ncbi:MAG: hypothetical protein R6W73_02520 [Candidatus Saliniplasma sp.]